MSNPYFRFKQFEVRHDRCAMKVGTDGVLLGAWTAHHISLCDQSHILDIGTGSGLIALMMAQQYATAQITAVDIDPQAVAQAHENFIRSPWADRLQAVEADICQPENQAGQYDLIVSNPPYFSQSLMSPDTERTLARHDASLTHDRLISAMARMLLPTGQAAIIIPHASAGPICATAQSHGLFASQITSLHTKPQAPAKRALIRFGRTRTSAHSDRLVIGSEPYNRLVSPYYLNM